MCAFILDAKIWAASIDLTNPSSVESSFNRPVWRRAWQWRFDNLYFARFWHPRETCVHEKPLMRSLQLMIIHGRWNPARKLKTIGPRSSTFNCRCSRIQHEWFLRKEWGYTQSVILDPRNLPKDLQEAWSCFQMSKVECRWDHFFCHQHDHHVETAYDPCAMKAMQHCAKASDHQKNTQVPRWHHLATVPPRWPSSIPPHFALDHVTPLSGPTQDQETSLSE